MPPVSASASTRRVLRLSYDAAAARLAATVATTEGSSPVTVMIGTAAPSGARWR